MNTHNHRASSAIHAHAVDASISNRAYLHEFRDLDVVGLHDLGGALVEQRAEDGGVVPMIVQLLSAHEEIETKMQSTFQNLDNVSCLA